MMVLVITAALVLAAEGSDAGAVMRSLVPIALVAFAVGAAIGFERTRSRLGRGGDHAPRRTRRHKRRG